MLWSPEELLSTLAHALRNVLFFCLRAERAGIEQGPYIKAVAYLTLAAVHQSSAPVVSALFNRLWDADFAPEVAAKLRQVTLEPVLNQLGAELRDICIDDCVRVSTDPIELTENQRERYWHRLMPPADGADDDDDEDVRKAHVVIERKDAPCHVGFSLNDEMGCPIVSLNDTAKDFDRFLGTVERIVQHRGPTVTPD